MMANALPYIQGSKNPASYTTNPVFSPPYEPYDIRPGEIWEWNLSVEHQFARDFAVSAAYVGSHGMNLQYKTDANQITNPALLASNDISGCNGATPATPLSSTNPLTPLARVHIRRLEAFLAQTSTASPTTIRCNSTCGSVLPTG